MLFPEVRRSSPGARAIVVGLAVPAFDQSQERRYQKLLFKQIAPPVANNRRSHYWAKLCREDIAFSSN